MQKSTQMGSEASNRRFSAVETSAHYSPTLPFENPMDGTTDRRDAIRQIAGGALALAATACMPAGSSSALTPTPSPSAFDMSWLKRINKRRRMVFDTFEVASGAGLGFVAAYLEGAEQAYGEPDASTVLVHRHMSVPIVMGDEMWKRMALGESLKMKDPATGEPAVRNPFVGYKSSDKYSPTGAKAGLDVLMKNGTIVVACNRALTGYAHQLANKEKIDPEQALKEMKANLIPGVYVVPNGVFGVCAAQEANCGYIAVR
jgi:hypothetical protein